MPRISLLLDLKSRWVLGAFLRWWPLSAMWMGPLICYGRHRGCLNNPIFFNLGLCAACWADLMCRRELWPISVSHPFPFLIGSLGLAGKKDITRKLLSLSLDLFFKILLFPVNYIYIWMFPCAINTGGIFLRMRCTCITPSKMWLKRNTR